MNRPLGLRLPKLYYGWVLLGVAIIAGSFSTGVGVWGASVFVRPMTEEMEWSRAAFYGALTFQMLVGGALAPIVGPMQDTRTGPMRLMLFSAVLLGVSLIGLRYIDSLWQFYLLFGVSGGIAQITGGFALSMTILPKWFVRKRGRVLGIAAMGPGLGPMLYPVSLLALIDASDWRMAWFVLCIVALCVLIPLSFLVRTRPEDMGLLPDGDSPVRPEPVEGPQSANQPRTIAAGGLTVRESVRTLSFWLIVAAFALVGIGIGGFHANLVPFYQDSGIPESVAALSATAFAVGSVSFRPVWGLLAERVPLRYLIGPQLILTAGTVLLILNVGGQTSMLLASGLHGLTIGAYITLMGVIVADYFGRLHLGAINGVLRPFMTASGAASPLFIAFLFDLQDSYTLAFLIIAAGWLLAGALMLLAKPPRPPERAATASRSPSTGTAV
ncbi:MAG: MFS transporter [Chloroflexota bacterium]|nr:MFS transporter [Chloroflexota bacterium]